jgi:hypothetical protein
MTAHGMLMGMHLRLTGRHPFLNRELPQIPTPGDELVIDARRLAFAGPLELTATVALAHRARAAGHGMTLLVAENPNVASYMQRMEVIRQMPPGTRISGSPPDERRTNLPDTLLEVSALSSETEEELCDRLGRLVAAHHDSAITAKTFDAIGELIANAVDHGASDQGAFVAAQVYSGASSGRPGLEVAICDTGIGVLAHLRRNPDHADVPDAASALDRAFIPGVSGAGGRRGNGLHDLLNHLKVSGLARFHLRSGDGLATATVGRSRQRVKRTHSTATSVKGTWAWLRIRIP